MQIVPMRELKNTVEIERLCADEKGPVFVTKNGYGRLVVMDIDYYQDTMQKVIEASSIIDGLNDIKAGKTRDGIEAVKELRSKYEI
ncbi:MAG: type II toxin-antitoxin system Phd/YefM family antitoxin [Clostridiales bacterium]|nr:type II toxin-antitoxin system Phd/YefM family antitoxin [Clostridiales bacterium]